MVLSQSGTDVSHVEWKSINLTAETCLSLRIISKTTRVYYVNARKTFTRPSIGVTRAVMFITKNISHGPPPRDTTNVHIHLFLCVIKRYYKSNQDDSGEIVAFKTKIAAYAAKIQVKSSTDVFVFLTRVCVSQIYLNTVAIINMYTWPRRRYVRNFPYMT